jgi:hypothetical protein
VRRWLGREIERAAALAVAFGVRVVIASLLDDVSVAVARSASPRLRPNCAKQITDS